MPDVDVLSADAIHALVDDALNSAVIDGTNHLVFTTVAGDTIDLGNLFGSIPSGTTGVLGLVQLATDLETTTGTNTAKVTTPHGVAAAITAYAATVTTALAGKQPVDSDLTTIASLTATTNNILMAVAGAWASATPTAVKAALAIAQADVSGLVTALGLLAPLASPTFTGTTMLSGRQIITPDTITISAAHAAIDASLGNVFDIAASSNFTLDNPSNAVNGQVIHLRITQDATGSRLLTLGSAWNAGTNTITLSTTANKRDHLVAQYHSGSSKWDITGFQAGF